MDGPLDNLRDLPLLAALADHLALTLGTVVSGSWQAMPIGEEAASGQEQVTAVEVRTQGSLHGVLRLAVAQGALAPLREPGSDADGETEPELLRRWAEQSLAALRAQDGSAGWEASVGIAAEETQLTRTLLLPFRSDAGTALDVRLSLDEEFAASLLEYTAQKDAENAGKPEAMNLDLVLDVELNVVLRFGQRQLTLREVLDLASGSVVELDRQVEEPVELLLEGKVIARGEAVVIDGNYGLRVTEVPQPISQQMLT